MELSNKIFLIGVGGTGMRCLESFVHLCASGMLSSKEVHMLALDTDLANGNFRRLKSLVQDCYIKIKGSRGENTSIDDSFFSAKLNFYSFTPDYQNARNFSRVAPFATDEQNDLATLLLSKSVREFDLMHGYRAQTHLGSMMMYHSIIKAVVDNKNCELGRFISEMHRAQDETHGARCFVLGSVFGGTGASSIPILPKALNKACGVINATTTLDKVDWGATLLTSYFHFKDPQKKQLDTEKIIASSKNFNVNSQAALMFYAEDSTVKRTYQKFYLVGAPGKLSDMSVQQQSDEAITGGEKQENPCHYIELICAGAAYDFFKTSSEILKNIKNQGDGPEYYYRGMEDQGLKFTDFVQGTTDAEELEKRLGMLVVLSLLVNNPKTGFFDQVLRGEVKNLSNEYILDEPELRALKKYLNYFHYNLDDNRSELNDAWLRQLWNTAGGSDQFLFHPQLFALRDKDGLGKFPFNKYIYNERQRGNVQHNYSVGILLETPFSKFKDTFLKIKDPGDGHITQKSEKLLKRTYVTLCDLYNFPRLKGA